MGVLKRSAGAGLLGMAVVLGSPLPTVAESVLPDSVRSAASGTVARYDTAGGASARVRGLTLNKDFTDETGVRIETDFNPDMTKFFAAMDSGAKIPWSLIEFSPEADFLRARDAGYLQKLDPATVDISKVGQGSANEYGVDFMRYGIVFTYNTNAFKAGQAPTGIRDIYDLKRFPGKRCLFKFPPRSAVLESALLADGVDRDKLYPLDLDRAFTKLDTIKSDIVWWANGDDAIRLLTSGECAMGIAFSGRVFAAVKTDAVPLAIVWKDSFFSQGVFGIPKGAPNPAAGQAMIAHFISDLKGQVAFVKELSYASDIKALDASAYGKEVEPWIVPKTGVTEVDAAYYEKNVGQVTDRFNRWVAQP